MTLATWLRYRRHLRSLLVAERDRLNGPVPLERYEQLKSDARIVTEAERKWR